MVRSDPAAMVEGSGGEDVDLGHLRSRENEFLQRGSKFELSSLA
jgi:hypothetical protein